MALHTWLLYLMAVIGLSLTPGPNGLLALSHGALYGQRKALFTISGGVLGFTLRWPCRCSASAPCSRPRPRR